MAGLPENQFRQLNGLKIFQHIKFSVADVQERPNVFTEYDAERYQLRMKSWCPRDDKFFISVPAYVRHMSGYGRIKAGFSSSMVVVIPRLQERRTCALWQITGLILLRDFTYRIKVFISL